VRLYYFTTGLHGLASIRQKRLKLSYLDRLNDPFEFLGFDLRNKPLRKAMHGLKAAMARRYGMVCMSTTWSHPLMWAHYGENHRGLCLGLDADDANLLKVEYVKSRLKLEDFKIADVSQLTEDHMKRLIATKFAAWSYENEYRFFARLETPDPTSGLHFVEYGDGLHLREVIVGMDAPLTRSELDESLGQTRTSVKRFKVRPAFKSFALVRNKNLGL